MTPCLVIFGTAAHLVFFDKATIPEPSKMDMVMCLTAACIAIYFWLTLAMWVF